MKSLIAFVFLASLLSSEHLFSADPKNSEASPEPAGAEENYRRKSTFELMAKTFEEEALKNIAESAVKKAVVAATTQNMTQEQAEKQSAKVGQYLSWGMAAWGFQKGAKEYLKADSESEKFHAAVDSAAAVIGVVPGWGTLVSFLMTVNNGVMRMVGAWSVKNFAKDILGIHLQTIQIYNEILAKENRIFEADKRALSLLFSEYQMANTLMMEARENYQSQCANMGDHLPPRTSDLAMAFAPYDRCVEITLSLLTSMELFIGTYQDFSNFPASHIVNAKFAKAQNQKTEEQTKAELEQAQQTLAHERTLLKNRIQKLNQIKAEMINSMIEESEENQAALREQNCRKILRDNAQRVFAAMNDHGRLRNSLLSGAVEDYKFNRDQFCQNISFETSTGAMARLNRIVESIK